MSKLAAKLLGLIVIASVLAFLFLFYSVRSATERHVNEIVENQVSMALSFDLAIRQYIAEHVRPAMQAVLGSDEFHLETMSTSFVARSIFEEVRKDFPDYIIKFSSDNPRNPANQAGAEELEIIRKFNADPSLERWQGIVAIDGKRYLAKFSARRMERSCLLCHGEPDDAPVSMLDRYGGVAGFHRPLGEVIGLDMVAIPVGRISEIVKSSSVATLFSGMLGLLCFFLALGLIVKFLVVNRLTTISTHFKKAALQDGDALRDPIEVKGNDEISDLARSFNLLSEKLRRYYAELDGTVKERTQELYDQNRKLEQEITDRRRAESEKLQLEERLAQSRKMEAIGLLAGGVAHDLNNVLSGIVSYPDLILMDLAPDSPLVRPVRTMKDSGLKAAAIVQDMLTLARRGVTDTRVLNLNTVVKDYFASPEFEKLKTYHPKVDFQCRYQPDLLNVKGSAVQLKKMVMNLISNASEAMPEGGTVAVSVTSEHLELPIEGYERIAPGDYCVLRVQDDGVGIDAGDLQRIFEPFYTKKVMGRSGTGLGMSVVWGIVQDHGGRIHVASTPGKGTLFEVFLPVTRETPDQHEATLRLEEYTGNGESILVVDDLKAQRELAASILEKLGYAVETAASGEEAVDRLGQRSFDLVVLDMIMDPGIDGLETYRRIRAIRPEQRAMIASGYSETERVKEARKLGAGRYLKKPYTIEALAVAVKAALGR